jgi:predicted O-linked N-acetylglucosamine transferase (SPINDLY family)
LLYALQMPELVVGNMDQYQALALELASNPHELAAVRTRLAERRTSAPLFDTDRFRRHLESAYETMWQRHVRGEAPASFSVPAAASGGK